MRKYHCDEGKETLPKWEVLEGVGVFCLGHFSCYWGLSFVRCLYVQNTETILVSYVKYITSFLWGLNVDNYVKY